MGREDRVGEGLQFRLNVGFVFKDVEPRARDGARLQGVDERLGVHDRAAGDVDEVALRAKRHEDFGVDHVVRRFGRRDDHDEIVAPDGEFLQGREALPLGVLTREVRVADLHVEGFAAAGDFAADAAESENSEALAGDARLKRKASVGPTPFAKPRVRAGKTAREAEDHREREVRDVVREDVRGVREDDAAALERGHVVTVVAHAEARDHAAGGKASEDLRRDARTRRADEDGRERADAFLFFVAHFGPEVEATALLETFAQNPRHRARGQKTHEHGTVRRNAFVGRNGERHVSSLLWIFGEASRRNQGVSRSTCSLRWSRRRRLASSSSPRRMAFKSARSVRAMLRKNWGLFFGRAEEVFSK